jgi:hypothetical protein
MLFRDSLLLVLVLVVPPSLRTLQLGLSIGGRQQSDCSRVVVVVVVILSKGTAMDGYLVAIYRRADPNVSKSSFSAILLKIIISSHCVG